MNRDRTRIHHQQRERGGAARVTALAVALAAALAAGGAHAANDWAEDCIDLSRGTEMYVVDGATIAARSGPRRFLIRLDSDCAPLHPSRMVLHADSARWFCGSRGDRVENDAGLLCAVDGVQLIDAEAFRRLQAKSRGYRSRTP